MCETKSKGNGTFDKTTLDGTDGSLEKGVEIFMKDKCFEVTEIYKL